MIDPLYIIFWGESNRLYIYIFFLSRVLREPLGFRLKKTLNIYFFLVGWGRGQILFCSFWACLGIDLKDLKKKFIFLGLYPQPVSPPLFVFENCRKQRSIGGASKLWIPEAHNCRSFLDNFASFSGADFSI